jgi:localization factor PodJL
MAYGASWRSKDYEPDPRDVVEEAARAAGLSVDEWLDAAASGTTRYSAPSRRRSDPARETWVGRDDDNDSPLKAITRRLERRGMRSPAVGPLPEERVARILSDAMEGMHESLRANEERTASALDALSRQMGSGVQGGDANRVRSLIGDLERGLNAPAAAAPNPVSDNTTLVRQLENKIANVVSMIEAKAQRAPEPPAVTDAPANPARQNGLARDGGGRDLRPMAHIGTALQKVTDALRGLEQSPRQTEILQTLRSLDQRLSGLEQGPQRSPEMIHGLVGEMTALRQAVAQQRAGGDAAGVNHQIASIGGRIDTLSQNLARQAAPANHFEKLFSEISDLRGQLKASVSTPDPGIAALQRQMSSMGDRLDALTDKLATLRMNAPRDLRPVKAIDGDLDELKRLIMTSQVPSHDDRVLEALQTLERKVGTMERTPTELSARLDRIQSMMGERPPAALPVHVEALLQDLADRLKHIASAPDDDLAFAKLHQEIQMISRKLEQAPGAMHNPAIADLSGLERSISAILHQMDALKADMGSVAETAARKATQEAMSRLPPPVAPMPTDVSGIERSIAGLFSQIDGWKADMGMAAADAARNAAQEAVSRMPTPPSAPVADLSGVEHSIKGLFQQMDSWKADMGAVAENAARKAAADAVTKSAAMQPPVLQSDTVELQRALSDMQMSQKDAEQKTAQTLEAVHNTLKRVVDRLVDMEKDMDQRALAPVPLAAVPLVQAPLAPLPPAAVPVPAATAAAEGPRKPLAVQADVMQARPLEPMALTPQPDPAAAMGQSALSKQGVAETVASLRAQRLGLLSPSVTTTTPPAKGSIGGMLAAARGAMSNIKLPKGKARVEPPLSASETTTIHAEQASSQPLQKIASASSEDVPLEPGSGRPGQQVAAKPQPDDAADPKAQFLAAARRAAQSAAVQTGEALTSDEPANGKTKTKTKTGSTKTSRLKPRHALLLGLAALVVAAGATLQFVGTPRLLGGKEPSKDITGSVGTLDHIRKQVQLSHQQRKNTVEYSAEAAKAPARQILPPPIEAPLPPPISRNVKPPETVVAPPGIMEAAKAQLSADPNAVGAIGPTIQSNIRPQVTPARQTPISADDPLLRFEGLRDAQRLKDAARGGDLAAYMEIGIRYAEGRGAVRDPKTAALWFERAGDLGSAPAKYRLGAMYREGRGVDRNAKVALLHFQSAAEGGNARAMHNTAVLLAEGVNGAPEYAAAADWFKKAAELGVKDSQFNLAILYARGLGTGQDLAASYGWFSAAAATGDEDAAKKRDEVGARMSPDLLGQAKAAAAAWKPKTPDPAANEINAPPGGWDAPAKTSEPAAKPKRNRT